jgi:hypothetical protein
MPATGDEIEVEKSAPAESLVTKRRAHVDDVDPAADPSIRATTID